MSQDSSELHELMKRAEVEGPLMPREDRKRLEFLIQQLDARPLLMWYF